MLQDSNLYELKRVRSHGLTRHQAPDSSGLSGILHENDLTGQSAP